MKPPTYLVVAGTIALEEHQAQALESLQAQVFHFELTTDSISYLIESGDGLVLLPGWEHNDRAVLEVQVAKAFGMPVKTHTRWLQTLPTPDTPQPAFTMDVFAGWEKGDTTVDLHSGEIAFDDPTITAAGIPHFADIVNLELDDVGTHLPAPADYSTISADSCTHRWVLTEEGVAGCENCGAAA